jgi:hypothetical protein
MPRTQTKTVFFAAAALGLSWASPVFAKPPGQKIFCQTYPAAPACASKEAACITCHTAPPALNAFGADVSKLLAPGVPRPLSDDAYAAALPAALAAAAALDSDQDGFSNRDEIAAGSNPADVKSVPVSQGCVQSKEITGWNLCKYDSAYVHRKIIADVCGRTATNEERAAFASEAKQKEALHRSLDVCLKTEFWQGRDGVVWNLANPKIKPLQSIKAGRNAGPVPLADYEDDYALFVHANSGDRDVRDTLVAQYLVEVNEFAPTKYTRNERGAREELELKAPLGSLGQTVDTKQRAGLISSGWFRAFQTMFTPVPRTTAAQAYRAYLGLDIALLEGLTPTKVRSLVTRGLTQMTSRSVLLLMPTGPTGCSAFWRASPPASWTCLRTASFSASRLQTWSSGRGSRPTATSSPRR